MVSLNTIVQNTAYSKGTGNSPQCRIFINGPVNNLLTKTDYTGHSTCMGACYTIVDRLSKKSSPRAVIIS